MVWGDYLSFEYGKPVKDKQSIDGNVPVFGTNGQIGTSHLPPLCKIPSFVVGRKGAYRGVHYSSVPFSVIDTAFYALPLTDKVDLKWAYYKFLTYDINRMDSGSAIPSTDRYELYKIEVEIPSLETQKKIVSVLDVFENIIRVNSEINENLYQMVATLYASIFRERVQQTTTVGQYSKQIYSGGTPSTTKPEFWNGPLHWFSSGETRNRFAITTEKTITQVGVDNSSTKLAHKYDIVMASAGQGFTRGQTTMLLLDTYVNQSVIVIHSDHLHLPYLFWNLSSRYEELRAISDSSSIRGSLTTKMIAGFDVPEVDQQSLVRFSEFAWPIIAEIEKNLHENEHLSAIRDMLLPKLMSGEIDVSDYNL